MWSTYWDYKNTWGIGESDQDVKESYNSYMNFLHNGNDKTWHPPSYYKKKRLENKDYIGNLGSALEIGGGLYSYVDPNVGGFLQKAGSGISLINDTINWFTSPF